MNASPIAASLLLIQVRQSTPCNSIRIVQVTDHRHLINIHTVTLRNAIDYHSMYIFSGLDIDGIAPTPPFHFISIFPFVNFCPLRHEGKEYDAFPADSCRWCARRERAASHGSGQRCEKKMMISFIGLNWVTLEVKKAISNT